MRERCSLRKKKARRTLRVRTHAIFEQPLEDVTLDFSFQKTEMKWAFYKQTNKDVEDLQPTKHLR